MYLWLLFITLAIWTLYWWYSNRKLYRLAAKIPVMEGNLPIIGLAHKFVGDNESIMSSLKKFSYAGIQNDGLVAGWISYLYYVLLLDPVDMEFALKTCLEKDDLHRFFRNIVGNGGIYAPVSVWRRRRKILVPAFSPKIVENFVKVFSEQSQKLVNKLSTCTGKGKMSIWPFLSAYTMDSVCNTALGVKINAQDSQDSIFLKSMNRVLNLVSQRLVHLWLQPDRLYKLFPQSKEHDKCIRTMHDFTDEAIRKKREEIKRKNPSEYEVNQKLDLESYRNTTFLDQLIRLSGGESGFTDIELREETLTMAIAGTDTSAVAMGYTMQLLAKYPEVQEKVYEELYDTFGDSDRPLVKEDLTKLKYLERVIKESMRLFPPVPFILRKVTEDTKLPSGRVVPAGAGLLCSIWGIHRDPKYWGPDAEHFDPDRFLPERFNLKHSCSYMPFSSGPRNCVGYQYALMSVKTALSTVLRQYRVVEDREDGPAPQIRVKLDMMMKAVDGYQVALDKRGKKQDIIR